METPPFAEQPLYSISESIPRALVPKILSLLGLALVFYLGVLLNISLLELNADQETSLKTGALILLALLIIVGILLALKKAHQPYLFYKNRITHGKETLPYLTITNTAPKKNFFDQLFKTYSIQLSKTFFLRHIPETIQLSNYLQQLIDYSRKNG